MWGFAGIIPPTGQLGFTGSLDMYTEIVGCCYFIDPGNPMCFASRAVVCVSPNTKASECHVVGGALIFTVVTISS